MAKTVHDDVLDQALNYVKTYGDKLCLCSAQPTTYTQAITTYNLATHTLTSADYTVADGDAGGRKVTVAEQAIVPVTATGTGTYIAICYSGGAKLLTVTTCSSQSVTSGNTVTFDAHTYTIGDPT